MASFEEGSLSYSKKIKTHSDDGPFQVAKRIIKNAYELDLPSTYLGSHTFNVSDLIHFSIGVANLWMNSL